MKPLSSAYKKFLVYAATSYATQVNRAQEYLQLRGISLDIAERFQLGVVVDPATGHESMVGRLCIPSIGPNGIYQLKFRCMDDHDCKDRGHSKYLTEAIDNRLYNLRSLTARTDTVCITEGEIDAITLEHIGFPALGVPGANGWKRHHPRLLAGFSRIYVFGDGDQAGRDFAKRVTNALPRAARITCPDGQDVNSIYCSQGADAVRGLMGD